MRSYQNVVVLQNLYRLKALGYHYFDPLVVNTKTPRQHLPEDLGTLANAIGSCHLCDLSKSRRQSMPGTGNPHAELMFVDSAVSMAEDESNAYYVGRSGASLKKMIENVLKMATSEVFVTHAVKCKSLNPQSDASSEWHSCKPYLFKQIELIAPKVIVTLGPDAYVMLTGDRSPFEQVRGQQVKFGDALLIPIYHPQYLLRNPSMKKATMADLTTIKKCL